MTIRPIEHSSKACPLFPLGRAFHYSTLLQSAAQGIISSGDQLSVPKYLSATTQTKSIHPRVSTSLTSRQRKQSILPKAQGEHCCCHLLDRLRPAYKVHPQGSVPVCSLCIFSAVESSHGCNSPIVRRAVQRILDTSTVKRALFSFQRWSVRLPSLLLWLL